MRLADIPPSTPECRGRIPEHQRPLGCGVATERRAGAGAGGGLDVGQLQRSVSCQYVEVVVGLQQRQVGSDGNGSDEAVDQLSDGLTPTATVRYRAAASS